MGDDIKKTIVFWHATGHMIAAHYNNLHYGGLPTEEILISQLGIWYHGEHVPNNPFSRNADLSLQQKAAAIAFYSYGSIVQAIWQLAPLADQFNSVKGSGRSDYLVIMDKSKELGLSLVAQQGVFNQIETHISQIRSDDIFNRLFDLPTLSLFRTELEEYSIDLPSHARNLTPFLREYELTYTSFVKSLQLALTTSLVISPQISQKKGLH